MTNLDNLRIINDANILYLKNIKKEYRQNEIIKKILDDEACFFKMDKNNAYYILEKLGIVDSEIDMFYKNLISYAQFCELYYSHKIDLKDNELLIRYPINKSIAVFLKKNNSSKTNEQIEQSNKLIKYIEPFFKKIINKIKEIFLSRK